MEERLKQLKTMLKIDEKRERITQLEAAMQEGSFWADHEKASQLSQELSQIKAIVDNYELIEMNPDDPEAQKLLGELEFASLFAGEYDANSAILSIHAGAGGTESQDWASMLLRMFQRFCERKGWSANLVDMSEGEEAGIKSATLEVKGRMAYGHLRSEAGVHRLVRISPFDADKARHTSFALVEVTPEVEKSDIVDIKTEDLKIDVYRAGGHGGQSVNTTDSAVRITHLPTGLVVTSQNERSQLQNKEMAMKVLMSRLVSRQLEEQRKQTVELRGEHVSAEWGNQIRSYVLHPYQMVKDHRTEVETSNTQAVLDGDIDIFIEGFLRKEAKDRNND
jgi:peptide chain release factor 2